MLRVRVVAEDVEVGWPGLFATLPVSSTATGASLVQVTLTVTLALSVPPLPSLMS